MSRDIPMIITNVLGLENETLYRYQEADQMFRAIILSLQTVPLSIFFSTLLKPDRDLVNIGSPSDLYNLHLTGSDNLHVSRSMLKYYHGRPRSDLSNASTISMFRVADVRAFRKAGPVYARDVDYRAILVIEGLPKSPACHTLTMLTHASPGFMIMDDTQTLPCDDGLLPGAVFMETIPQASYAWKRMRKLCSRYVWLRKVLCLSQGTPRSRICGICFARPNPRDQRDYHERIKFRLVSGHASNRHAL